MSNFHKIYQRNTTSLLLHKELFGSLLSETGTG